MSAQGEAAAQRLEEMMARLISTVHSLDEATLHHLPGEGEWTATQTLAHVAEMVPFWANRAQMAARGTYADRAYDRSPEEQEARNSAVAAHGQDSRLEITNWLESSTPQAAETLRAIPDEGWARSALWASDQVRHTVGELVQERLFKHVEAHIDQASRAARA